MADSDWMPGCTKRPGNHAGYTLGKCKMVNVKLHFTVGTDSTSIGDRGFFQFLVPKDGPPIQFAEANSICYDSGSWNGDGPGIEFERLSYDDPLTPSQVEWGGKIVAWLHETYGIPLTHYDGPRVPAYNGFINHGSLLGRDGEHQDHTDGVTAAEWAAMTAIPAPPVPMKEGTMLSSCTAPDGTVYAFVIGTDNQVYTISKAPGASWVRDSWAPLGGLAR